MRTPILRPTLIAVLVAQSIAILAQEPSAQPPTAPASQSQLAPAASPAPGVTASSVLQPSLTQTQTALSAMKIDKWKKGSVRDEAGDNVTALLRDLQTNLPPLLTAADAEPGSLSRAVPLIKHLDAFYDVLLRVEEAARVSAPSDQIATLQQTLLDVNKSRIAYDDLLQAQASSQEKQVFALRSETQSQKETIAAQQEKITAASAVQPCKPATSARRKKSSTAAKTTSKPSTGSSTAKPSAGTPATPPPQ